MVISGGMNFRMTNHVMPDHRMMLDDVTQHRPPDCDLTGYDVAMKSDFTGDNRAMWCGMEGFMGGIRMTDL
ncbi:hypothetical protein [Acidiphilium rubrum]|uniref:hypothetical protein n=3 Tax=Acidiphilium TaxID=522 RepID=UPI000BCCF662|nr:hypothetical protein [Acidiphilium rubrum]OZB30687.1 MAG: hypothetical protein B7X49_02110 [Acidiphilium sp. 34-64-41]